MNRCFVRRRFFQRVRYPFRLISGRPWAMWGWGR